MQSIRMVWIHTGDLEVCDQDGRLPDGPAYKVVSNGQDIQWLPLCDDELAGHYDVLLFFCCGSMASELLDLRLYRRLQKVKVLRPLP